MSMEDWGLSINCIAFVAVVAKDSLDGIFKGKPFKLSSLSKIGLILIINLLLAQIFELAELVLVSKVMIVTLALASIFSFAFLLFILIFKPE